MDAANTAFLMLCSLLVLLMTPSLAMFYSGLVSTKNTLNTIMNGFIVFGVISLQWIVVGYSLAFSGDVSGIVGTLDFAFLKNVAGVNENGVTTIHPEESVVAKAMIENAQQNIIIADSSKIGKDGFCNICRLPDVDLLITDRNVNSAELEKIAASGINIQLV